DFSHERLLVRVHGVRTPTNQFGRILPMTLPITTSRAPSATCTSPSAGTPSAPLPVSTTRTVRTARRRVRYGPANWAELARPGSRRGRNASSRYRPTIITRTTHLSARRSTRPPKLQWLGTDWPGLTVGQ